MPIVTSLFPEHDIVQALPTCLAADQLTEVGKTVSMKNCSSTQHVHCMKVQLLMEFMYIHGSYI